jgi:hypothetical protein
MVATAQRQVTTDLAKNDGAVRCHALQCIGSKPVPRELSTPGNGPTRSTNAAIGREY